MIDRDQRRQIGQLICNIRVMWGSYDQVVNYAIGQGLTLRAKQRPLTEREVFARTKMLDAADRIVWMEELGSGDDVSRFMCQIGWDEDEECYEYWMIGCETCFSASPYAYGKTWRCWASRPTDEDYEAAKWEE